MRRRLVVLLAFLFVMMAMVALVKADAPTVPVKGYLDVISADWIPTDCYAEFIQWKQKCGYETCLTYLKEIRKIYGVKGDIAPKIMEYETARMKELPSGSLYNVILVSNLFDSDYDRGNFTGGDIPMVKIKRFPNGSLNGPIRSDFCYEFPNLLSINKGNGEWKDFTLDQLFSAPQVRVGRIRLHMSHAKGLKKTLAMMVENEQRLVAQGGVRSAAVAAALIRRLRDDVTIRSSKKDDYFVLQDTASIAIPIRDFLAGIVETTMLTEKDGEQPSVVPCDVPLNGFGTVIADQDIVVILSSGRRFIMVQGKIQEENLLSFNAYKRHALVIADGLVSLRIYEEDLYFEIGSTAPMLIQNGNACMAIGTTRWGYFSTSPVLDFLQSDSLPSGRVSYIKSKLRDIEGWFVFSYVLFGDPTAIDLLGLDVREGK